MELRIEFNSVNNRMERFDAYLTKLYFSGKLNLNELQSFRKILEEIKQMFNRLRAYTFFGFAPGFVKEDFNKLTSELTLMEYKVSLISFGAALTN